MQEAYKVRKTDRLALLEELKKEVEKREARHGHRGFQYDLANTLLRFLENELYEPLVETVGNIFFRREALPRINQFARAKEERDAIVCDLLKWVTVSITARFYASLRTRKWPTQSLLNLPEDDLHKLSVPANSKGIAEGRQVGGNLFLNKTGEHDHRCTDESRPYCAICNRMIGGF